MKKYIFKFNILYDGNIIKKTIYFNSLKFTIRQVKQLILNKLILTTHFNNYVYIDILKGPCVLSDKTTLNNIYNSDICYLDMVIYNSKL